MAVRKTVVKKTEKEIEVKFSKNQLLAAKQFRRRRDILDALLSPDETYTVEAVEEMIGKYMKGKVK